MAFFSSSTFVKSLCPRTASSLFNGHLTTSARFAIRRQINTPPKHATFGFMFDVDGVLVRGNKVIPAAIKAFQKLVDLNETFRVPVVFVTNAGNHLRSQKAQKLSETLGVKITEDQVIMAHSPLKMLKEFHNKRVLVSGQGPIREISKNLGFTNMCTVEDIQEAFPVLDVVDHRKLERLRSRPRKIDKSFPPIEAVILMQEPVEWDSALQLIIDVVMTNGKLLDPPSQPPYPHLPLIACNMDLQWMSEAWMPRFGHGAFLICLEELYKKLTGKDLVYTEIIGKPSLLTMRHADNMAQLHAQTLGFDGVRTIYFVGDNLNTDIFGANLYHQYLTQQLSDMSKGSVEATAYGLRSRPLVVEHNISHFAVECHSVLVETGVHSASSLLDQNHTPRDFVGMKGDLKKPCFVVPNVHDAIELAFKRENFA